MFVGWRRKLILIVDTLLNPLDDLLLTMVFV